ncbi:hypothetical protein ILYODFUR_017364 [Ilyodon furcidens]|uniref:Uncharacterized protein n=1 Tax=Ilyodon furcidens TaxID=33524 RepID=A0ABV0VEQ2_9TELE
MLRQDAAAQSDFHFDSSGSCWPRSCRKLLTLWCSVCTENKILSVPLFKVPTVYEITHNGMFVCLMRETTKRMFGSPTFISAVLGMSKKTVGLA